MIPNQSGCRKGKYFMYNSIVGKEVSAGYFTVTGHRFHHFRGIWMLNNGPHYPHNLGKNRSILSLRLSWTMGVQYFEVRHSLEKIQNAERWYELEEEGVTEIWWMGFENLIFLICTALNILYCLLVLLNLEEFVLLVMGYFLT